MSRLDESHCGRPVLLKCGFLTNNISVTWEWLEMLILELDPNLLNQDSGGGAQQSVFQQSFQVILKCAQVWAPFATECISRLQTSMSSQNTTLFHLWAFMCSYSLHYSSRKLCICRDTAPMSREGNQGKFSVPYSSSLGRARPCLCIHLYTESILLH